MSQKDRAKTENLQVLLEQHWLHCRHLESERAWFMSVYAAITGGMFTFMAYIGSQAWWSLYFLVGFAFVGFFLTIRWTYAFECHRIRVSKLARILWLESGDKSPLDPTMDIPTLRLLPKFICGKRIPDRLQRIVNELFRTRYWFALFYFFILIGLVILSFVTGFSVWGRVIAIAALVIASFLGVRWYFSLKEMQKIIVLEGCNGEWAQKYYLPFLAEEAGKGAIELWAVDMESQIKLSDPRVTALWQAAQSKGKACYLDKTKNKESYETVSNVNYVFIVTPDQSHCQIAEFWLERLGTGGKIFIEKPLDASVASARRLKEKIEGKKEEAVFVFDHYFAEAYPLLYHKRHYLKKAGHLRKIDFHILEASGIPPKRQKTLDKGMIFDLFCHVLALVYAVVSQNLTCSVGKLRAVELKGVKAARYTGCPISGETFAWIKFMANKDIQVISVVGKGVGTCEEKFMRLYGSNGNIKLDFVKDEFSVFDLQEGLIKQGKLNLKHVETFLEDVLQGKENPILTPGVVSFNVALEILEKVDEAEQQIGKMPVYQYNDSIDKILEILGERELH